MRVLSHVIMCIGTLLCLVPTRAKPHISTCPELDDIVQAPFQRMDSLSFASCSYLHLIFVSGAAYDMSLDTVSDQITRSDICLSLIADELQRRSKLDTFKLHTPEVQYLLVMLSKKGYHLGLEKPSDTDKLFRYIQEGRWEYIMQRFFDRQVHLYFLLTETLVYALLLAILWRRQRKKLS